MVLETFFQYFLFESVLTVVGGLPTVITKTSISGYFYIIIGTTIVIGLNITLINIVLGDFKNDLTISSFNNQL